MADIDYTDDADDLALHANIPAHSNSRQQAIEGIDHDINVNKTYIIYFSLVWWGFMAYQTL